MLMNVLLHKSEIIVYTREMHRSAITLQLETLCPVLCMPTLCHLGISGPSAGPLGAAVVSESRMFAGGSCMMEVVGELVLNLVNNQCVHVMADQCVLTLQTRERLTDLQNCREWFMLGPALMLPLSGS